MIDFISILKEHLPKFKKVLELESKQGDDLKLLDEYYEVVASENEKVKTRYLKDTFIDIRVILVDNIELDIQKKFDCVFSNKKLDSYNLEQIQQSLENQIKILNDKGLIFHIFDSKKVKKDDISNILLSNYELLKIEEIEDCFYTIAIKR